METVRFDDTGLYIEWSERSYRAINYYEFRDCLEIVLTSRQYEKFVAKETNRSFRVSLAKIQSLVSFIEDKNNRWRK